MAAGSGSGRIVIDPVTRIEGHLRVELEVDAENNVSKALSAGTMWRGIELIMNGRDPRDAWAFTQRICGICTGPHALASLQAVENALGIKIPENANSIRNIMDLAGMVHDHIVHFYALHAFDWVDVPLALDADPRQTSVLAQKISSWPLSSPGYFRDVQTKVRNILTSGQPGPFRSSYWGHPAYKLPAEATLLLAAHYLEALNFQKEIVKIHTVFGGKNPHPNWIVGGVPCPINLNDNGAVGAINMARLNLVSSVISRAREFVYKVYIPDLKLAATFYRDWLDGGGIAGKNLLSYGGVPVHANDWSAKNLLFPQGAIVDGKLTEVLPVDLEDPSQIEEFVDHSWYAYPAGKAGYHPYDGYTESRIEVGPRTKGSLTDVKEYDEGGKYSFVKAPRWRGRAMEVGPLARYVIGYVQGNPEFKEPVDKLLRDLDAPVTALFSTLGRTAARGLETAWAVDKLQFFYDRLIANLRAGDSSTANPQAMEPATWPKEGRGVGFMEAPRGALAHYVKIENGKITHYQCVVPSTWNASPRDGKGQIGAYEASLTGMKLQDPKRPLEALRTIHSFDPCLACATHVFSPQGDLLASIEDKGPGL